MPASIRAAACLLTAAASASAADLSPSAPKVEQPPNIVLIAVDTLRADHLHCHGYKRRTSPHIDRLASQGVLFERCYSVASWTLPSFASLFTGLLPMAHGVMEAGQTIPPGVPTLPEQFKRRGYYCGAVVSNPCVAGKFGFSRGFDLYDDYSVLLGAELGLLSADPSDPEAILSDAVTSGVVTDQAVSLLKGLAGKDKPFFLFVLYFDPHDSYIPPHSLHKKFDPDYRGRVDGRGLPAIRHSPPSPRDLRHLIARYDGEIVHADQQIGRLLAVLDKLSDPSNTLVIFVSDHGEAFGEHGMLLHGNSAYREEIHVPMIWRWRGVLPKGHRVKAPVLNMDIAKTLTELMRFEGLPLMQGASLWPGLLGRPLPEHRPILSQKAYTGNTPGRHVALTAGDLRLHARFNASKPVEQASFKLYDATGGGETADLSKARPAEMTRMRRQLARAWNNSQEIHAYYRNMKPGPTRRLTDAERRRLESLGYYHGPAK